MRAAITRAVTPTAADAEALLAELGVRVRGFAGDLNIDGSIGSRTASLRAPYADAPEESGTAYLSVAEAAAHLAAWRDRPLDSAAWRRASAGAGSNTAGAAAPEGRV